MSKKIMSALFVSTALTLLAPNVAMANAAATAPEASNADNGVVITVTARRSKESLQNVPVSETVLGGDVLQKQSITNASDISKLAPGLNIGTAGGSTQAVTLRGVTWQPGSGTPATPIYMNEVPFDPASTLRALFDIGQIEVLRGPQGTTRGAPSISGAVLVSAKKPDLGSWGGYAQASYGEANHWDLQGALNIPLIKDVLAIRAAVNIEDSEANRIYSVNDAIKPLYDSRTYRVSMLFKPTDTLTVEGMWQRRTGTTRQYDQVVGAGSPGFTGGIFAHGVVVATIPANFNGPALGLKDRASVEWSPTYSYDHMDLFTANVKWKVLGQQLEYIFGKQINTSPTNFNSVDAGGTTPGYAIYTAPGFGGTVPFFQTQEVRLSSDRHAGRFFDYDLGYFQKHSHGSQTFNAPAFLPGAFGADGTYNGVVTEPNSQYILNSTTLIGLGQVYDSFYGNVVLHLPHNTELSAGIRQIRDRNPVSLRVSTYGNVDFGGGQYGALYHVNNAGLGDLPHQYPCSYAGASFGLPAVLSTNYAHTCDIQIPNGFHQPADEDFGATAVKSRIYNISLSHKFSNDLMAYFNTGTSYRSGLPAINNPGLDAITLGNVVGGAQLNPPKPEYATSYELGLKYTASRRLFIAADVFQIDYANQLTTFEGINYWYDNGVPGGKLNKTSLAFYSNVNARVRGFEFEVASKPTDELSLGAHLSYTPISSRGGIIPCNVGSPIGDPSISGNVAMNFCTSTAGTSLNQNAPFQATINGSYQVPLTEKFDGYVRFNINYQGSNPNFGNFQSSITNEYKTTGENAVVDLFAGLTGQQGAWDLGVYVKNVFNNTMELNRYSVANSSYGPYAYASVGYDRVLTQLPREIGMTLRYAFGSR